MLCREPTSDQNYQARLNRLNLTAYIILDIGNRDIIGIAISWPSDIHFRNICYWINQYPYQYLVFIVISFSVLARQWICLWCYNHFYISIDVFEGWWIKGSVLPHLNFSVLATCYYDLILTWCSSVGTKKKQNKSDGQAHLVVGEYWANDTSVIIFPEWMKDPIPNRLCRTR